MKFFIDTAEIKDIRELAATGLVDGVTTNPSLIAKSGRQFVDVIKEICGIVPGPVSAEVTATDHATMLNQAHKLAKIASNVVIKVPLTPAQDLQGPARRRNPGQRHAVFLCRPGDPCRQMRRQLHLSLHRPARRCRHRRHAPGRRYRADL
jgi:hypothetical protein